MASLLRDIAVAGVRKPDGSAAASAKIWCLLPGASSTATIATVYTDKDGLVVMSQPIIADAAGRAVIYVKTAVRLYIEDANGNILVQEDRGDTTSAAQVEVENAGFTGTILSGANVGSQAAGGRTDLDRVLASAHASVEGLDFNYLESPGAKPVSIHDKLAEGGVSAKDFGAVGDGVTDDTAALQAALLRGGAVRLPRGNYRITSALVITGGVGLLVGDGIGATKVTNTAGGNALELTACSWITVRGITFAHATTSTKAAIAVSFGLSVTIDSCALQGHTIGIDFSVKDNNSAVRGCEFTGPPSGTPVRGIRYNTTAVQASYGHHIENCTFTSIEGRDIEFNGNVSGVTATGNSFSQFAVTHVQFNLDLTGKDFAFWGNLNMNLAGIPPFDMSDLIVDPNLRQWANNLDGYAVNVLTGATMTPDRSRGRCIRFSLTTTGAGVNLAAPTPQPSPTMRDVTLVLQFRNVAGAPITAYASISPFYRLSAPPSLVNNEITSYTLLWDPDNSVWRDIGRVVTT